MNIENLQINNRQADGQTVYQPRNAVNQNAGNALYMNNVMRTYDTPSGKVDVLKGVSLSVANGEWVAVMGSSGAGKSTLLRCASGLDTDYEGDLNLAGMNPKSLSEAKRAQMRRTVIGFIFQDYNLVESLTVRQNAALPLLVEKQSDWQERTDKALKIMGIEKIASSPAVNISGGQKQRTAIARCLAMKPNIVFADEPTGALDVKNSKRTLEAFGDLKAAGVSILMVTHDVAAAAAACADRVVILEDGRVSHNITVPSEENISAVLYGNAVSDEPAGSPFANNSFGE